jgi:predicted  nucleic acid-binding Zn-ribbon protein
LSKAEDGGIVLKPGYLETPKGKIPTYEFTMGLAKAINILDEAVAELEEKIKGLAPAGTAELSDLKARLESAEEGLKSLEKRLELELEDLNDKLMTLTDVVHELAERVQRLEESARG